jgi:hypothetical protein
MSVQYVKQFNADLGELSLSVDGGKHWRRYPAGKISRIQKTMGTRKRLFLNKPVERLEIVVSGEEKPYVIEKGTIKDDFQWITEVLRSFAEKNKIEYVG